MKTVGHTHRAIPFLRCGGLSSVFLTLAVLSLPSAAWAVSFDGAKGPVPDMYQGGFSAPIPSPWVVFNDKGRSSEDGRIRERYEQWQNLSPAEKETLRRRMDQWKQMSPQDRQRYEHRHQQWRRLTPEEQDQIHKKLDGWQHLSPEEKERIRNRFPR